MDLDRKRNQINAINNRDKWINPLKTIDKSDDFRSITYEMYELIALTLFF